MGKGIISTSSLFKKQTVLLVSSVTRCLVYENFEVMSMYLRVKRKNTTTLLHVEPSDSFQLIKQRIATLFSVESHQIMLLGSDKKKELVELATVSDQGM